MHDMRYFGGEIINLINNTLECTPTIDRGNIRCWCDNCGEMIVFLSLDENNYRGALEVHKNGEFKDQLSCNGVLSNDKISNDYFIDENKITCFLNKWKTQRD